jgi:hypothetical protein
MRQLVSALVRPDFEGFPREVGRPAEVVTLTEYQSGLPAEGECWLRVGVRFRRDFTVLLADRPLAGSGGVYQLPAPSERPAGPIGLVSPVWSPADDGTSADTRKLGVAVEFLQVICW